MRVLGIETSCDETGIAIYDSEKGLLANNTYTQKDHLRYGGVVPELASRDHIRKTLPLIIETLKIANLNQNQIDAIAYTKGPGLAGALMVGALIGRTLGFAWNKPTLGIHHLEGHLLAPFLSGDPPEFPFLALLVSGGHTELIHTTRLGHYEILGDSLDDAVGEAFDKTAKLLGLPYPGGAELAKLAEFGKKNRFKFPKPMVNRPGLDFSFSGLKTYAVNTLKGLELTEQNKADIAFAFQEAVVGTLAIKCKRALKQTKLKRLVISGGVSANIALRQAMSKISVELEISCFFPPLAYCTDNGAMIAYAGCQRLLAGEKDDLTLEIKPRWPLSQLKIIESKEGPHEEIG